MTTTQAKPNTALPSQDIAAPKKDSQKTNKEPKKDDLEIKTDVDVSALHKETLQAKNDKTSNSNKGGEKIVHKELGFLEKFLHDFWPVREWFALGNEIAESCYELAEHLLPKPIANALYGGFWSLAVIATGSRVTANATAAKKEDKIKAGAKMLLHDGISAIGAPTIVARLATAIQNKLYEPLPIPQTLKHIIKSILSLVACKLTIKKLDPHAMKISGDIFKYRDDRHRKINEDLAGSH